MSLARLRPGSVAASAVEYASVTEQVALKVARLEGAGTPEKAYTLATEGFREEFGRVPVSGQVAILREERLDEQGQVRALKTRPGILGVGGVLGGGEAEVDLAVEPVEGLHLLARGQQGAISAVAASPRGTMLRTPDMYMSKLIVGPRARGTIDIDAPVVDNIRAIAEANGRKPSEITVAVLDRPRHEDLIEEIRETGARIEIQAKTWPTQRSQVEKLKEYGLEDPEKKLALDDLIQGDDVVFAATGITMGETLYGVRYLRGGARTHTVVMSTAPRMVRFIDTIHAFEPDAETRGIQI